MRSPSKSEHVYRGHTILPCVWNDSERKGYRWRLVTYHISGMMYDEQNSPRFATLADARAAINARLGAFGEAGA